jgi:metal-responsive CopG/Arc/MetJ family transcriptional regulator
MKIVVSLPDRLFRKAELVTEWLGLGCSEVYRRVLTAYLEKHRSQAITEKLDVAFAKGESGLDRVLESIQATSLPKEDW